MKKITKKEVDKLKSELTIEERLAVAEKAIEDLGRIALAAWHTARDLEILYGKGQGKPIGIMDSKGNKKI